MKFVTHSGPFHSDDVFAAASLLMRFGEGHEIIRTRDPVVIASGDIVFDVGREYDESRMRFDHHQGPKVRANGIPYASFGLIWRRWGSEISGSPEAAARLDLRLVQPIDAGDNSLSLSESTHKEATDYKIQDAIKAFRPTWLEVEDFDAVFFDAVNFARSILVRGIAQAQAEVRADKELAIAYKASLDKRILVLEGRLPTSGFVASRQDILFVVSPDDAKGSMWAAKSVGIREGSLESRKKFPEAWANELGDRLAAVSGVQDAVFCHRGRFIAVAKSKEGAVRLATLAADA